MKSMLSCERYVPESDVLLHIDYNQLLLFQPILNYGQWVTPPPPRKKKSNDIEHLFICILSTETHSTTRGFGDTMYHTSYNAPLTTMPNGNKKKNFKILNFTILLTTLVETVLRSILNEFWESNLMWSIGGDAI